MRYFRIIVIEKSRRDVAGSSWLILRYYLHAFLVGLRRTVET
jgi:hypothetical protein